MKCQQTFCPHQATSNVFIEFRIRANMEPVVSGRIFALCDACATQITWDDVMPDEDFKQVCEQFKQMGRMPPVKEYCNILIQPMQNELSDNSSSL